VERISFFAFHFEPEDGFRETSLHDVNGSNDPGMLTMPAATAPLIRNFLRFIFILFHPTVGDAEIVK
jgi:hypothetical protein